MLKNTVKALQALQQPRRGGAKDEERDLRDEVEDGVANGDFVNFYGDNPVAQQLGAPLGRMLKEKSAKHEERLRDGAKGTH
jgi:hypothetical protein